MTRALIDQDITPTERLTGRLPDSWDVSVGLPSEAPEAKDALGDADVVFVTSRVPLSYEVIDAATDLKVVGKLGTGLDSVDLDAARLRGDRREPDRRYRPTRDERPASARRRRPPGTRRRPRGVAAGLARMSNAAFRDPRPASGGGDRNT